MKRIVWGVAVLTVLAGLGVADCFLLARNDGGRIAVEPVPAKGTSTEPRELTDANFSSVTASGVVLVVLKDGKTLKRLTGLQQESDLAAAIEDALKRQ